MKKQIVVLLGLLCLASLAGAMVSTNYNLSWDVIGGGGGPMSSSNYRMASTVGQIIGVSESTNYRLEAGYWSGIAAPPTDTQAPAAIMNLATSNPTGSTITLSWTAPGDDGTTGTASTYDIRYQVGTAVTDANWATAIQVAGEPALKVAGSSESFTVTGLTPGTTYYFAIKTADEVPNWSPISNSPSGTTTAAEIIFDTGASANSYPSSSGTHNGTITPSHNITVSRLYTYLCNGTGGHAEYVKIWRGMEILVDAEWAGYSGDWQYITFDEPIVLEENETYFYTITTGSYPQIIHASSYNATGGVITCTEFVDSNGQLHEGWIPAIRLE